MSEPQYYQCGHLIKDPTQGFCPLKCVNDPITDKPPNPEDMKLFSAKETDLLIRTRLDEIDQKIGEIPEQVSKLVTTKFAAMEEKRRNLRKEWMTQLMKKYVPAGGYGALILSAIQMILEFNRLN